VKSGVSEAGPSTAEEGRAPRATAARAGNRVLVFLGMIKVSHTLFALPFAIGAALIAAGGLPPAALLGKVVLAVLFARTAAMSFNRWADRRIDAENPRTRDRAIPAGLLSPAAVLAAAAASAALFVGVAAWIGPLPLALSPVALAVLLGYSLAKRFTSLCHFILGAALGLAPVGAWVAVRGSLEPAPWLLGGAVLLWTAGFDILYATLDHDFDRARGLHSLPVRLGVRRALRLAALLHAGAVALLIAFARALDLGAVFLGTVAAVAALLVVEHRLVRPDDLRRVNQAFFGCNIAISVALLAAMAAEAWRRGGAAG
jgi:4-hydroxybenzoate polyprenyltransferase